MFALPRIDPEYKSLIPPLQAEEREQLEQNILQARKCYDPIIVWDGVIIDGHNRFEICEKHGIEFQVVEMPFPSREAAKLWILENQLGRRNLPDAARIEIALLKAEMLREKARENQSRAGGDKTKDGALLAQVSKPEIEPIHVRKALANEAGVGETTLRRYMEIKNQGSPELLEHVHSGKLNHHQLKLVGFGRLKPTEGSRLEAGGFEPRDRSAVAFGKAKASLETLKIRVAHQILETKKQLQRAGKMYKFIARTLPFKNDSEANQAAYEQLNQLSALLDQLLEKLEEGSHQ